jgi:hypothetical protein
MRAPQCSFLPHVLFAELQVSPRAIRSFAAAEVKLKQIAGSVAVTA